MIDLLNFYFILANFSLPDTGEEKIFAEVIFPDLDKEAATKLVEEYNKVININFFIKIIQINYLHGIKSDYDYNILFIISDCQRKRFW